MGDKQRSSHILVEILHAARVFYSCCSVSNQSDTPSQMHLNLLQARRTTYYTILCVLSKKEGASNVGKYHGEGRESSQAT